MNNIAPFPVQRFSVALQGADHLPPLSDSHVVFHGINKSGSLAMADVIRDAYMSSGRANQFFSHYHRCPADHEDIIDIINHAGPGHTFFVAHYLYGAIDDNAARRAVITQFRHPLPRVVSCYQWLKKKHVDKHGTAEGFPSLERFVLKTKGKHHSMLGQLGVGYASDRDRMVKEMRLEEMFDNALEALETKIAWFGIAEYFEESIFALAHLCALPSVAAWKKDTRNANRSLVSDLPQSALDQIAETFRFDLKLYERAKQIFFERIKGLTFGPDFERYKEHCSGEYKDRLI